MNIVVPTDFSAFSLLAVKYALKFAKQAKAKVYLLNVVYIDGPPRAMLKTHQIKRAMEENARRDFAQLKKKIRVPKGVSVQNHIVHGHPVHTVVNNFTRQHGIDLIIMGTKGATGLKKAIMGSNAAGMISHAEVPVITIPEHAQFKKISNILYATDLKNIKQELKKIISFGKNFNSKINILHITSSEHSGKESERKIDTDKILSSSGYKKIAFFEKVYKEAAGGIQRYTRKHRTDLIVLFPHKKSFFDRIFHKSVTKEMAFQTNVPLLTFSEK